MDSDALDEYYRQFFRSNRLYAEYASSEGLDIHVLFLYRLLVHDSTGLCQRDICACLGYPKQTMSRILKKLQTEGIVKAVPSERDAREKIYSLSHEGEKIASSIIRKLSALENACLKDAGSGLSESNRFNVRYLDAFEKRMRNTRKGDA